MFARSLRRTWPAWAAALLVAAGASAAPRPRAPAAADPASLAAVVTGPDVPAAVAAAGQLGAAATAGAHEVLLDVLASGLGRDLAPAVLAAVAASPAPADVATLSWYAGHRDPVIRGAALAALAPYPSPEARAILVAALGDRSAAVRGQAATALARGRSRAGVPRLFKLLARGEQPAIEALAALADVDLARQIGELLGQVPEGPLATCLGLILSRADFGPDDARLQVVRALGKMNGTESLTALSDYVEATPAKPPRPSRREAEMLVEARLGGD